MPSSFHNRFGIPGIIAVFALVFAMAGGAIAAKKYVITSTSQIKPNVLKQLKGQAGTPGTPGAPGANGKDGQNGAAGQAGSAGNNGTSVTSSVEPKSINCKEGGTKFQAANGTTYACNGEEGSPWSAGGTLPSGETETGSWAVSGKYAGFGGAFIPISYSIPLSEADAEAISDSEEPAPSEFVFPNIHILLTGEDETTECPGTAAAPDAIAGHLCIYTAGATGFFGNKLAGVFTPEEAAGPKVLWGTGTAGAVLYGLKANPEGALEGMGSWAVTAP